MRFADLTTIPEDAIEEAQALPPAGGILLATVCGCIAWSFAYVLIF